MPGLLSFAATVGAALRRPETTKPPFLAEAGARALENWLCGQAHVDAGAGQRDAADRDDLAARAGAIAAHLREGGARGDDLQLRATHGGLVPLQVQERLHSVDGQQRRVGLAALLPAGQALEAGAVRRRDRARAVQADGSADAGVDGLHAVLLKGTRAQPYPTGQTSAPEGLAGSFQLRVALQLR